MAYPENVIPRIQQTDFNDLKATEVLRDYFGEISSESLSGSSAIPLGTCDGALYEFYPSASSIKLDVAYFECKKSERDGAFADDGPKVAPLGYFYLQMSSVAMAGSQILIREFTQFAAPSSSPTKRKVSAGSSGSAETPDSGYRSASVEPPMKKVKAVIARSDPEAMAAVGTHEGKMGGESQAINVPTGPTPSSLPGITSEYVGNILSRPFFLLGDLGIICHAHEHDFERGEYVVAVNLLDHSLWITYDAWDDWWEEADEDEINLTDEPVHPGPFRPAWRTRWAQLPHGEKRALMGKVADDLRTCDFSEMRELQVQHVQDWPEKDAVPVFINARVDNDGKVVTL
ncbi:MAG: hypothetical protein M1816_004608 [Peltula sp. TS41687]|nr:MAG: hypothetical protein M1816_004608 [Peltula sp. TS41687]